MPDATAITTFLFTDIEGSTRQWEREPARMERALARHDAICRFAVERHRGTVVKMVGDSMLAAFSDPVDAIEATLELQLALADASATDGMALHVRCGLHSGVSEHRDDDLFGSAVNRAARIMGVAHGGQTLVSEAVAALARDRLAAGTKLRDLGVVRLRDLTTPEHVYQLERPPLRSEFPALRSLEATPNNLPQQMTSFIGRQREVADVAKLLDRTRLLTLTGSGGLGKTRLSLQVAADAMDEYPDGVWLVELAPVADAQRVPQVVATMLGVKEDAGHPVLDALIDHVRNRRLLIVLDNCEHLIQACAELAASLLRAGAELHVLATSREPLHVAGEAVYPIPGLALPATDRVESPAELAVYDAVRLFIARAEAVQPSFRLTAANAAAVAAICRHLDGIPLAIELAAARVRTMPVDQIAVHLNDRFRLLTGGDRTALPRQRTLRACIDWSYDLLDANERALLRRLSAFAGGFTLDAAEKVTSGGEVSEADVLDLVSRLVEKSLVEADAEDERYRLLDTMRQYAQEQLTADGEQNEVWNRHLDYYLALVERARPELAGPKQAEWLSRLDFEVDNVLAAHAWVDRVVDGARSGLRIAFAIKPYWLNRGLLGVGYRVTIEALAHADAQARDAARCGGLADAGQLAFFLGRYEEARKFLEESLEIAREIGDAARIEAVLQPLGMACLGQGNVADARRHLAEALVIARELGNKREITAALNALGQLYRMQGELEAAESTYEEALALARDLHDREFVAIALLNLAMVSIGRGSLDRVPDRLLEVLAIANEIGSKPAAQSALEVCAALSCGKRQWASAARFYGAAAALARQTGLHRDPTDEAFLAPLVGNARAALGDPAFTAAETAGSELANVDALQEAHHWLATRS